MLVTNLINSKGNPVVNQFVIYNDNAIVFQSYSTEIARIYPENFIIELNKNCINYSQTTSKHLYIFLNQFLHDYYNFLGENITRKTIEHAIKTKELLPYTVRLFTV